jgi:hypothetical protein
MVKRSANCLARQYADQTVCAACGLSWDTNDPEPPACRKVDRRAKVVKEVAAFDAEAVKLSNGLPDTLPADVAADMFRTLQYARGTGSDGVEAMRRAYRVLLDRMAL